MKRLIIVLLLLQAGIVSLAQTISYKHGKLWSEGVSLNYESINQQLGPDVLELYEPARSEYVKGLVMTGVGSGIFAGSVLLQYIAYRFNPSVFDVMSGKRSYEEANVSRHAAGGMRVLAGIAASGLVIGGLGAFHIEHGGGRIKKIANTYSTTYSYDISLHPSGICLAFSF